MDKLSMCRICLVKDVKMYSLFSAELQELYERLTRTPFETKDKKPVQVCYLCCARLQNCYRLQAACLKSEEFFNKVIADSELNEMELQDLNTLKTVHPLILISCEPLTRKDTEDDKIDEDNDFKFEPLEIPSDVQIKHELVEDDSFSNVAADIKLEGTVTNEDICIEHGDILDNSHTMEDTELKHDISLKIEKIVPERINLEHFKIDDSFINEAVHIKSEVTVKEEDITEDSVMSHNSHTMQNTELEHDIHLKPVKIVFKRIDSEESETGSTNISTSSPGFTSISNTNSTHEDCQADVKVRKGQKRKCTPNSWTRNKVKILRNCGKSYISKSKKQNTIVPAKSLKQPCTDKCKLKCTGKFTESQRKNIFESFWEMGDWQRQREFILRHLSVIEPRYTYKMHNSNRGKNNAFHFTIDDQRIRVCKLFFKATLDITDTIIRTVLQKKSSNSCGTLELDNRGKHRNHSHLDPTIKAYIKQHINSIPKIRSHYCRSDTKRLYIDGSKTVADLHRDYELECQSKGLQCANYLMYYKIFHSEFNIAFYQPKKDQC